jgi:hypothetical protein
MITALHSAGDLLHFHPHIYSIAIDGTVDENGTFHQLTELDSATTEKFGIKGTGANFL